MGFSQSFWFQSYCKVDKFSCTSPVTYHNDPVCSELCWCVLTSWNENPDTLGVLLLPQAANLQCLRWRVWVGHRCKYSHHCGMWPALTRSSACLYQLKYSLACAHTKWLKNWETPKALTIYVFFKTWPAAFLQVFGSKFIAVALQWGPCSQAVPAEGSAAVAVLLEKQNVTHFKNASCAFKSERASAQ